MTNYTKIEMICLKATYYYYMGHFTKGHKYKAKINKNSGCIHITDDWKRRKTIPTTERKYYGYHYKRFKIIYPNIKHKELVENLKVIKTLLNKPN